MRAFEARPCARLHRRFETGILHVYRSGLIHGRPGGKRPRKTHKPHVTLLFEKWKGFVLGVNRVTPKSGLAKMNEQNLILLTRMRDSVESNQCRVSTRDFNVAELSLWSKLPSIPYLSSPIECGG